MKRQIIAAVIFGFFFVSSGFSALTAIGYETTPLSGGRWQNSYKVRNISLSVPIEEFTIWFDFGLYANLKVETPKPLAEQWDEIIIQPEPIIKDDGYYDALTLGIGIEEGQTVSCFTVSFDWLGEVEPGKQWYEIVDPVTLETIDDGWTIPEPVTIFLLGLGAIALRKRPR